MRYSLLAFICLTVIFSCKKYNEAEKIIIKTGTISNITPTKAFAQGTITNIAEFKVEQHGHCWSSANDVPDFRINQGKTMLGEKASDGAFSSNITGLFPSTRYYVRSFFIANNDTIYGNDIQVFKTLDSVGNFAPNVATGADSAVAITSAFVRGTVVSTGNVTVTSYGHCYSSTVTVPTIANTITNLGSTTTAPRNFTSSFTGLTANTTYYARAYATNSVGTSYGNVVSFTTSAVPTVLPTVTTIDTFYFGDFATKVKLEGRIVTTGTPAISEFGHLFTSDSLTPNLTIANATKYINTGAAQVGNFITTTAFPNSLTTYRYKAYATNTAGTAYGSEYQSTTGFLGISNNYTPPATPIYGTQAGIGVNANGVFYYGLGFNTNPPYNVSTSGKFYKFNDVTGAVTALADCPVALAYANSFYYNNKIYVIGGIVNNSTGNDSYVLSYDIASNTWAGVKNFTNSFWGGYGFLIGNKYYVIGGIVDNSPPNGSAQIINWTARTLVYDIVANTTSLAANIPGAEKGFGASFAIGDNGYTIAGKKKQVNSMQGINILECYKYNSLTNTWQAIPDLPLTQNLGGVQGNLGDSYNNFGYVWGGSNDGNDPNAALQRYNPTTNTWKLMHTFPLSEVCTNGVGKIVNRKLVYGTGLNNGDQFSKRIYVFK